MKVYSFHKVKRVHIVLLISAHLKSFVFQHQGTQFRVAKPTENSYDHDMQGFGKSSIGSLMFEDKLFKTGIQLHNFVPNN